MSLREKVLLLDARRNKMEEELQALIEDLNTGGLGGEPPAGLQSPLVDDQGFPRADIDLFETRRKRHRVNCLRNDLKALMKTIESGLQQSFIPDEAAGAAGASLPPPPSGDPEATPTFAVVSEVVPGSPAMEAGFVQGDRLVRFGDIHAGNHRSLAALATVVGDSIGRSISVLVLRGEGAAAKSLPVTVTPKPWSGRGVLGCRFVPLG